RPRLLPPQRPLRGPLRSLRSRLLPLVLILAPPPSLVSRRYPLPILPQIISEIPSPRILHLLGPPLRPTPRTHRLRVRGMLVGVGLSIGRGLPELVLGGHGDPCLDLLRMGFPVPVLVPRRQYRHLRRLRWPPGTGIRRRLLLHLPGVIRHVIHHRRR